MINKQTNKMRIILLCVIGTLIILGIALGLTYAFMRPQEEKEEKSNINIKACAKVQLKDTNSNSINLKNTYPMDDSLGLETEPYEFTINSTCEDYVGFNLYLTSLTSNEIADEAIHYALVTKENTVLTSGILANATNALTEFSSEELKELDSGIKGTHKNIYKVFSNNISFKGESEYELYLWVDKDASNDTMGKSFKVGLSIKSYNRKETGAEELIANANEDETLYYHNENLTGGAEDDSYRYAGGDNAEFNSIKNFVCLDGGETTTGKCANGDSDLYRIIGLFKNDLNLYEMKLIKYDYVTSSQLGETGAYKASYSLGDSSYKGNKDNYANIGSYFWTSSNNGINEWAGSALRETNLNDFYINNYLKLNKKIDTDKLIALHTWYLSGNVDYTVTPKVMYDNEMDKATDSKPSVPTKTKTINDKIGLMYESDYGYAASPSSTSNWKTTLYGYASSGVPNNDWMFMGLQEWSISRISHYTYRAFGVAYTGDANHSTVNSLAYGVRPCFYLDANIQIKSGDGSKDEPYRLLVE